MRAALVLLVLAVALAAAAWTPGAKAHAEPGELRMELVGMIDTAEAFPPDTWLASLVLVNETEYTWTYPRFGDEPLVQRSVRALGGWEPLEEWKGHGAPHGGSESIDLGRIRPNEKIPFLVFGNARRGVQRVSIELNHRSARAPVQVESPPLELALQRELLPQELQRFEHARPR